MSKTLFDTAAVVESCVWQMRLGDQPRSYNRTQINDLFNGLPPETNEEADRNNRSVNVNFLEPTRLSHDARSQALNALTKPGNYFTVDVDRGDKHKRKGWSSIITKEIARIMKRSLVYYEKTRSDIASLVLHGIGPGSWDDREHWCPDPLGVEDVLVPSNTKLTMKNLPFFAIYRPYTANQLRKLTTGPKVDPAWNIELVNELIEKVEEEIFDFGIPASEFYSPEKMAERLKSDGGTTACDAVPTIDAWDFYFWNDADKVQGWNRRIVLDASWQGGVAGVYNGGNGSIGEKVAGLTNSRGKRDEFLYNPGKRKYASKLSEIIHWQFADLSAVAPFRYHSVRSLGFLLYAVCHLQNRLRCRFADAVFEHMMQYFRVRSTEDVERALKINLHNQGFVDETVQFVPAQERWQVNAALVGMALADNANLINQNAAIVSSSAYREKGDKPKTATEVMADVQATTQLVSAALSQAYEYKRFEYMEIARRFARKNSRDGDVRKFRKNCLDQGVPEEILESECWNIEPERVMGAGNKMLEMAITEKLMAARQMFDPEPQRAILRDYTLSLTDDPARANNLVPEEQRQMSRSIHDAQLAVGTLMAGAVLIPTPGTNHEETVITLLEELGMLIEQTQQSNTPTPEKLMGFGNIAQYIGAHLAIMAQDDSNKQKVKQFQDVLSKMGNDVRALGQQLEERMQSQLPQGNGELEKERLKLQAQQAQNELKLENARTAHSQRTSQRQVQSELEMARQAERHQLDLEQQRQIHDLEVEKMLKETAADDQARTILTVGEATRNKTKALSEPKSE